MRILVTGGCGFIGSHTVRNSLMVPEIKRVVNLDALTYSGQPENLNDVATHSDYRFVHGSINDKTLVENLMKEEKIDIVFHLAAESHVDRSIHSVEPFVTTNIDGTRTILEAILNCRRDGHEVLLIHISTDEVYGSLGPEDPPFTEDTPLNPRNPYAATKAASDFLVQAFSHTHGLPAVITRCSNNYGPNQFPEKLIPLMTLNALEEKPMPVYGDGKQIRDWIHVDDHVDGILTLAKALMKGECAPGEVFNMGADNEKTNIEIVRLLIELTNASHNLVEYVTDRLGHDRRYAMGYSKMKERFGWKPRTGWGEGIRKTVQWYTDNTDWINSVRTGAYLDWIEQHYR